MSSPRRRPGFTLSVRFVADGVDPDAWLAAGPAAGGEAQSLP